MTEIDRLVLKHSRTGVLLDTNLLVLFLIGLVNPSRIGIHKRLSKYTPADFDLLKALLGQFQRLFTTPHVLTETANLAELSPPEHALLRQRFAVFAEGAEELYEPSRHLVGNPSFQRFGLADAAIATASVSCLVVTDDLNLCEELQRRGLDGLNFNHLRASSFQ